MVVAIQQVRKMRGGAQSHLMLGSDGHAYVVKFQNNPQHLRILVNEFLATGLARHVGLSVPEVEIVDVPEWLIASTPDLKMECERGVTPCQAGRQFGSRFAGGLLPGHSMDYLPESKLSDVVNREEFAGMLVMDKWTCNSDGRQAVFHKSLRDKRYTATFIDQGYCFNAGSWTFDDAPLRGVYARNAVYQDVKGWDNFEPWLSRLEKLDPQTAWDLVQKLPREWYGGSEIELEQLVETLFLRRWRIRELIGQFRDSSREPFPQWQTPHQKTLMAGRATVLAWTPRMVN